MISNLSPHKRCKPHTYARGMFNDAMSCEILEGCGIVENMCGIYHQHDVMYGLEFFSIKF